MSPCVNLRKSGYTHRKAVTLGTNRHIQLLLVLILVLRPRIAREIEDENDDEGRGRIFGENFPVLSLPAPCAARSRHCRSSSTLRQSSTKSFQRSSRYGSVSFTACTVSSAIFASARLIWRLTRLSCHFQRLAISR